MTKSPSQSKVRIVATTIIVLAVLATAIIGLDQYWFAPQRRAIQADLNAPSVRGVAPSR